MRFFEKTKGAVSIFLVIILVPMLTVSSLFVDASRVKLSKAVMSSAGDLTMNTALTDYDTVLKDMYGLFATAQDKEDLFAKLEDYYRTCIVSSGISGTAADSYVSQLMASLGKVSEGDTSDLLNMQLTDFSTKEVTGANLANATIVKSQIVNFMKYRSPINTGLSFISSLKSFSSLSKQTELVEKRKEYYEEQQTVMENCKAAWGYINSYNKNPFLSSDTYFSDFQKKVNTYKDEYNKLAEKTIKDLFDTQSYVSNEGTGLRSLSFSYTSDAATVDSKRGPFSSALSRAKAAKEELNSTMSYPSGAYDLQYLVQVNRKQLFKKYSDAMSELNERYQDLVYAIKNETVKKTRIKKGSPGKAATKTSPAIPATPDTTETYREKRNPLQSTSSYDSQFNQLKNEYLTVYNRIGNIAKNIASKNQTSTADTHRKLVEMYTEFVKFQTDLTQAKNNLDEALKKLNDVYNATKSDGSLETAKNNWSDVTKAEELRTSALAKQDSAEIKDISSYLKSTEVDKLVQRLKNISGHLDEMLKELDKYQFFDTKLPEIKDYASFKNLLGAKIGDSAIKEVPIVEAQLNSQINSWLSGKFKEGKVDASWVDKTGTQANLITDKLNFYTFLFTHFNVGDVNDKKSTELKKEDDKNGKETLESLKSSTETSATGKAADAKKGNITQNNEIKDKPELPSTGKNTAAPSGNVDTGRDTAVRNTSASLASMFTNLGAAVKNMAVTLRDDLYVSDYVMSMLSYDTIENEYKVSKKITDPSKIVTLTKQPINSKNNFAYGREAEYIIYGGDNNGNVLKAYGSIFGIRLGFNLIYAFLDSSIRDGSMAIATPISAATLGVIPVPLIQAAIIIGLAVCESALDLSDLRDGKSVPIFKSKDTWRMSFTGILNVVKDKSVDLIKDAKDYAIDRVTDKLGKFLDKTDEELAKMTNAEKEELIVDVESSFDSMIERHANTAIQKLTTLANNAIEEAKLNEVGFNDVNYVSKGLDDWLKEEANGVDTTTDIGYIAKAEAVKIIKNSYIKSIIDSIKAATNTPTETIGELGEALQDEIVTMREEITDQVNKYNDKIAAYRTKMLTNIKSSLSCGAQKLKEAVNEGLDGALGNTKNAVGDGTATASLLSFKYSDYMRLFLMIGLLANENATLLRTADVIQCNMQQQRKDDSYRLKKAVTYVETSATVQVKPLLLPLPLFADVEANPKNDSNWYTIKYKGIKGY